jgi:hypothetical protein
VTKNNSTQTVHFATFNVFKKSFSSKDGGVIGGSFVFQKIHPTPRSAHGSTGTGTRLAAYEFWVK